jgi:hypothetical protein
VITRAAAQSLQASTKAMDIRSIADRLDEVARRMLVLVDNARRDQWTPNSERTYQHLLKLRTRAVDDLKKIASEMS